jgi:glycosyltransferase involved in cell wall biosynthesis
VTARRITIVASELLGRAGTGGAGTADSLLAIALGRHGHRVQLLIASGREIGKLSSEWARRYEAVGVGIRVLERIPGVSPPYLAPPLEVFHALRAEPPDVVIADDWRGLGFLSLRARQTGLALTKTAFVIHCHGPGRVLTEFAQKVPDTLERFGEDVAERGSIELADTVVSPSAWLLDWMKAHGWPVPESAKLIQYVRESAALGETPERAPRTDRITRLAFFGQLREGKGIRLWLTTLGAIEPHLLDGRELVFLGSDRGRWTSDRIADALDPAVKERVSDVRFETRLEREDALAELRRPGTLAVMPSLLDNSPNTVSECIEQGVPFLSTETGGIPELVAEEDRERVLCAPTTHGLAASLTRALESETAFAPARPAQEPHESLAAWVELVDEVTPTATRVARPATHVAIVAQGEASTRCAYRLAEATENVEVEITMAESRRDGIARTAADWIVFLDDDDEPDNELVDRLVAAQAASDADVVTTAVRRGADDAGMQLFLGDPGGLGIVENQYGVVGLVRGDLAAAQPLPEGATDPDWPLFARIALAGGRVVSIPEALATHAGAPGNVADVPGEGLAVLEAFEEQRFDGLRDLPQLAATLAAAHSRSNATNRDAPQPKQTGPVARLLRRLRS